MGRTSPAREILGSNVEPRSTITTAGEVDVTAAAFGHFAFRRAGDYAPLYRQLGAAIAADHELLAVAAKASPGQSRPDLFLAAVHYLLHEEPGHPAAQFYPSLTLDPDRSHDPAPAVLGFCHERREQIEHIVSTSYVQTNEVRRCTFLLPALQTAATITDQPLALIEVGASAGLNLLFDRYQYRYIGADDRTDIVGDPCSPLLLECWLRGSGRPPLDVPVIQPAWRTGIDLRPLNPATLSDQKWLRALVWPDHTNRMQRLDAALALAAQHPVTIREGPAELLLPDVVRSVPPDTTAVVYHSAVLAHMTVADRQQFTKTLQHCSRHRPLLWIQAEPQHDEDARRLRLTVCTGGEQRAIYPLGRYHPHGEWLSWEPERQLIS